jgi:hypothetical protein
VVYKLGRTIQKYEIIWLLSTVKDWEKFLYMSSCSYHDAIQAEVTEDPPIAEVGKFFKLLKATEESLHEHTEVNLLAFITRLMTIKSKYFFSNNCYNDLMKRVNDILPKSHKVPKGMYQIHKIDVCFRYEI